jgi:single-strand DNA-binding protein
LAPTRPDGDRPTDDIVGNLVEDPRSASPTLGKGDRVMVTGRLRQRSWETPDGDKRSVTELEADEVGASLKWATAKIERSSQRGNDERSSGRERQAERGGDFNEAPPF